MAANAEVAFAYRQFWCWTPPARPPLATVVESRQGKVGSKWRRFLVEFSSDAFAKPERLAEIKPNLTANPGRIVAMRSFPSKERMTFRVVFDLEPTSDGIGTIVTSFYYWSDIDPKWREANIFPIISEAALRATLGILDRTVRRGYPR